jgi:uncharacterized protein (DUF2147 family)
MHRSRIASALAFTAFALITALPALAAEDVRGLWKIIDDKTNKPRAYVLLYLHDGQLYGRMVATIDKETGRIQDTLDSRSEKAEKLAGDPFFAGLDFVYELQDKGKEWRGRILDPESGEEYDCRLWKEENKLIVRGQLKGLGFLGRNQTWMRADASEIPGFAPPCPIPRISRPSSPAKNERTGGGA